MTPGRVRLALAAAAIVLGLVVAIDAGLPPAATIEATVLGVATAVALRATSRLPAGERSSGTGRAPASTARDELSTARDRLAAATATLGGLHFRLLPMLRRSARHRCERHGVDLDDPVGARALLGGRLHDLVRPDRPRPRDRDAPGIGVADLAAAVARLEQL